MKERGRVGPVAKALGFAGLLPQLWAVGMMAAGEHDAFLLAAIYPSLILSFLGGIWWGFAMQQPGAAQARLVAIAIVPSLVALGLTIGVIATAIGLPGQLRWWFIVLGSAIMLTLFLDRHLARTGEAPDGWMGLRVPLSLGLGGLTIVAGVLIGR